MDVRPPMILGRPILLSNLTVDSRARLISSGKEGREGLITSNRWLLLDLYTGVLALDGKSLLWPRSSEAEV